MKHVKRITEGELWELVKPGRDNVKISIFADDVTKHNKTEYSSHALAEVVYG